ncbi:MAG TPA: ABC transporter permease [Gemmatimonadaceae bacterium]|nr:ABC transporter permease [Gemmatimonadaceae bacterium]
MEAFVRDLRFAGRMLLSRPGFTVLAVVCLALGIGASAAIFSVVNGVLLKPLPFPEAERLFAYGTSRGKIERGPLSAPDFVDLRSQSTRADLAVYTDQSYTLRNNESAVQLLGAAISSNLFRVLGVSPLLGRSPSLEEELPKRGNVVVISYGAWQRWFNGDPKIIDRKARIDASDYTVIGVMPKGFSYPMDGGRDVDAWVPLTLAGDSTFANSRGSHFLRGVGRLKPGVSLTQAGAELHALSVRLAEQYPGTNRDRLTGVKDLQESIVTGSRTTLLVLAGAVCCLLLIACANVANLMLARATLRSKEVAVRTAIGASRFVILRQVLTESVLLAAVGGIAGLLLAVWGTDLLLRLAPSALPRVHDITLDWRVLAFTTVITIGTGLLFGFMPAIQLSASDLNGTLKEGGRSVTGAGGGNRTRSALVVTEVALSLILLAGAGLLSATLLRLQKVDPGFDASNVLTAETSLPESKYKTDAQQTAFYDLVLNKVRTIPGVVDVAGVSILPLSGNNMTISVSLEGESRGDGIPAAHGEMLDVVTPDFFSVMKIPLEKGRLFAAREDSTPLVVLVNEAFAKKYWPGQGAVGKRISVGYDSDSLREIVGVVGDVRRTALNEEPAPAIYLPHHQAVYPGLTLLVRTRDNATNVPAALMRELTALDPDQTLGTIRPMRTVLAASLARQRFSATLLGIFAMTALALSAVGIFGVMTAMVTQRTRELAVRLALGAHPRKVLQLVLSHGATLAAIGIAIGLFGAFALSRVVAGMLYNVAATDPLTLFSVSLLLAAVALLACYIPARRATRLDPIITLREE